MIENFQASLVWKLRQGGTWLSADTVMPAESAARVAVQLLRIFVGRSFTPAEVSVTGDVRRFHYRSDGMTLQLRRLK